MGFLDKVKDATGVGLNAEEQYRRAYEKGVFLQPPDFTAASKHFTTAAEKFRKDGNTPRAEHAEANALMYALVQSRDVSIIPRLQKALERLPQIEKISSQDETLPTSGLISELDALQTELRAEASTDLVTKANAYKNAAGFVLKLGTAPLVFADRLDVKGPRDRALARAYYYNAMADYHMAFAVLPRSPEEAHGGLHKAAAAFRQAQAGEWASRTAAHIENVQAKRHCWTCGREMQGRDFNFKYYPATTNEYHKRVVGDRQEDLGMLDRAGEVTLCAVCGSAIERQADAYATQRADEVRQWVAAVLESHRAAIANLESRVANLERHSHSH